MNSPAVTRRESNRVQISLEQSPFIWEKNNEEELQFDQIVDNFTNR